jgi:putrescine transport system substrate-binding protein
MTRSPQAIRLLAATALLLGAALPALADEEKVVNVYNWVDYIGETTIQDFEAETGIKVVYDTYDASETVDAKMMAGHSGYDVVLHGSHLIPPLVKAGVFAKIDKAKLTNYGNLDPDILKIVAAHDPGNEYLVPYMWGTVGFAYNVDMIKQRMADAPVTSLDMLFKPELAKKWADCGISILESPTDMIPLALSYLHKNPNSQDPKDYQAAAALFKPIRQYIKAVDSANYLNQLPNQELCLAFSWSGDYATAASRAAEAGVKINLAYSVPDSGGPAWFDGWLIPSDAPHPDNALVFINYMLRPKVIAAATNFTNYANANKASELFVNKDILENPAIYPDAATRAKLYVPADLPQAALRARTRAWSQIKSGQ